MARGSQALKRFRSYVSFAADTFLFRRVRPYLMTLVINDKCNLDCFYCASKNTGRYDLDRAQVWAVLSAAYGRGHRALVITGGEPMLWCSDGAAIGDVLSYARELGFVDIAVFTNGTFPLDAESVTFIVSIDGTREAHNAIRANTYDAILEHVREANAPVVASITLSKASAEDLEDAIHEIAATGLFSRITFNLLTHNPDIVAKYGLTGNERLDVLDRLWRLKRQGYPIVLSKAAYRALRANDWKRPIRQIELYAGQRLFTCCRDVVNPDICRNCGYSGCVEIAQALRGRPSAIVELMKAR
ncbi:MAG: radical SAM protein [Candidatus Hydrogenedentes bacterium]|nr:radical SAM protein [Candidatus Hydrogenedentota bacterium]